MSSIYQRTNTLECIIRTVVLVILYFLFLYAFIIPGYSFGSAFVFLVLLSIYTFYSFINGKISLWNYGMTTKMVWGYWVWNVFLLIYVFWLIQIFGNINGITPLKDYIQMLIILPLFYYSGNLIFRNLEELMRVLYIGVIIQSIIIIVALFFPVLTLALTLLFPEGAYNSDEMGGFEKTIADGYKIGLGVYSSAGCLKMAIGQIGAFYYLIKSRGSILFLHLFVYLLIASASTMVARTGLLVSMAGLFIVFIVKIKQEGYRAFKYVSLFLFSSFISYLIITTFLSSYFLEETFQRLIDTADKGIHDTYFRGYTGEGGSNTIPPLCFNTIMGLGITSGTSGSGITAIIDGGFLKNYSAMGLIVVTINYIIIARFLVKQYKFCRLRDNRGIILFISFILLIGEFKEYYIYYISPICFIFLILSLIDREKLFIPKKL